MRKRHRETLAKLFQRPAPADVRWQEIESLLLACGAEIEERAGSRIGIRLHGVRASIHRPHPRPVAGKGLAAAVRDFLEEAGITP